MRKGLLRVHDPFSFDGNLPPGFDHMLPLFINGARGGGVLLVKRVCHVCY